jgi:hypothetical protein
VQQLALPTSRDEPTPLAFEASARQADKPMPESLSGPNRSQGSPVPTVSPRPAVPPVESTPVHYEFQIPENPRRGTACVGSGAGGPFRPAEIFRARPAPGARLQGGTEAAQKDSPGRAPAGKAERSPPYLGYAATARTPPGTGLARKIYAEMGQPSHPAACPPGEHPMGLSSQNPKIIGPAPAVSPPRP